MSKGEAMIRRRKLRLSPGDMDRARFSCQSSPAGSDIEEETDNHMFDEEVLGPMVVKAIMSKDRSLFLGLLALRCVNALMIQTHFVPDEYWQSLEVGHNMAFGYGYMTWEWREGLRGYTYPLVFAVLFKIQQILGLDTRILMIKLPRLLQGVLAAVGDLYLYKLSRKLSDTPTAQWTLLCHVLSWFTLYCCTRTLTNSTEAVLVTIALYYFPWPGLSSKGNSSMKFLAMAALSVIVRPTAAIMWILLCSWHIQHNSSHLYKTLKNYILVCVLSLGISALIDRVYYNTWTCVQWNFLQFNVLTGDSAIYGTHPWHWYVSQGFPVVMATQLFPFIMGAWKSSNKVPLLLIIWNIFIYSFLPHKEFRFLLPILPLSMHYCGVYFQSLCQKPFIRRQKKKKKTKEDNDKNGDNNESCSSGIGGSDISESQSESSVLSSETSSCHDISSTHQTESKTKIQQKQKLKSNLTKAKVFVIILIITNIPAALYFSLIHQRGTIVVMKFLYDESTEKETDILFLMPCHSTPYYSYIHRNVSMRFLTCEPNLQKAENYTEEADLFYNSPIDWLKSEYAATHRSWPSHIVYFNVLQPVINSYLLQSGYKLCNTFFHTHIPEGRVGSQVMVSCR
ncbi:hypothetical protein SNE40_011906 [Patella caerulea]|uniref:Mannosyltransferase n=2 Tax=Patella caerulea TaxID=87958 RepID=A0AAN8PYQ5_PATCE